MVVCYWISETVWMSKDQLTSKLSISFVLVATHSLWLVTFRGYINSNVIKLFSPNISVISLPSSRSVEHLDPSDESPSPPTVDYSEKRSLPVTIPDHQQLQRSNEKFVVWLPRCGSSCIQLNQLAQLVWSYWTYFFKVFNIHMAGRHLCSRRYSEFTRLHSQLKKDYPDFMFPSLPGKWPFKMSDQQLDTRRRGLEQYLEKGYFIIFF